MDAGGINPIKPTDLWFTLSALSFPAMLARRVNKFKFPGNEYLMEFNVSILHP